MRFGFIGLVTVIVSLFSVICGCIGLKFSSGGGGRRWELKLKIESDSIKWVRPENLRLKFNKFKRKCYVTREYSGKIKI